MNYKKHYDLLVEKRKNNPVENEYSELHHIVPKFMGGKNTKDNLIRLTAREHYIAHALLYKHFRTPKSAYAWFSMLRVSSNQKRFFTSKQYESARKFYVETLRESMIGENNHFFGKTHNEETRKNISEKNKKWNKMVGKTKEQIKNWVEKVASKPASDKQKETISRLSKNKVMLKHILTGEVKKIDKSELSSYNPKEWKNPSAISQRREVCVYCGKESVAGNIKRWHNENCKLKES